MAKKQKIKATNRRKKSKKRFIFSVDIFGRDFSRFFFTIKLGKSQKQNGKNLYRRALKITKNSFHF